MQNDSDKSQKRPKLMAVYVYENLSTKPLCFNDCLLMFQAFFRASTKNFRTFYAQIMKSFE